MSKQPFDYPVKPPLSAAAYSQRIIYLESQIDTLLNALNDALLGHNIPNTIKLFEELSKNRYQEYKDEE